MKCRSVKAVLPVFCLLYTCFVAMPGAVSASTENQAPVSIGTSPVLSLMSEGAAATVDLCAYFGDPDGDTLTFAAWTDNASVVTLQRAANLLTITPKSAGSAQVMVRATDPGGLMAQQQLSITVSPPEAAPPEATTPPEETTPTPPMEDAVTAAVATVTMGPDLVVDSVHASPLVLETGAMFRVDVTVRNQGTAVSGEVSVRFYLSSDETITMADTPVRRIRLKAVAVDGTRGRWARLTAPETPGVYNYGVCIEGVENEANTENNCSSVLKITVVAATGGTLDTDTPVDTSGIPPIVEIPDSHLALKVREALKIPVGDPIPGAQLATLTELDASAYEEYDYKGVKDLTGLEYAKRLTSLVLVNHRISDFTPLSGLTRLASLELLGDPIPDLSPFKDLTQLKNFYSVFAATVTDFTPLSGLTQLEDFHVDYNDLGLTDATTPRLAASLAGLKSLKTLGLSFYDPGLTDATLPGFVASLAGLETLKSLGIYFSEIHDVTPFATLGALERLSIPQTVPIQRASIDALLAQNPGLVIYTLEETYRGAAAGAPANTALAAGVPDETVLLANYPNPFNPETWIPYHLAKPAEVSVTIYDVRGVMVRHLALGHQPPGVYKTRDRAAYWDGRNQSGEKVASGVYFYVFTAAEFSATRKMLILK